MNYLKGITFPYQTNTSKTDGLIREQIFADCILRGCAVTYSGASVTIAAGAVMIKGRTALIESGLTIATVPLYPSGFGRIKISIDMTRPSTTSSNQQCAFEIDYSATNSFPELSREDINSSGELYEATVGILTYSGGNITTYTPIMTSIASLQTQINTLTAALTDIVDTKYRVGDVIMNTTGVNPGRYYPGTTWAAFSVGRSPVGVDPNDADFNEAGKTGGSKTHTNTVPNHNHTLGGHTHTVSLSHAHGSGTLAISRVGSIGGAVAQGDFAPVIDGSTSAAAVSGNTGGPSSNSTGTKSAFATNAASSMHPYETCYFWKRVA